MDKTTQEKPPWKTVEWIKSPRISTTNFLFSGWETPANDEVFKVKDQIGLLDKEHRWELAKKMVNPYELVYTHDDERLPPSLSLEQPLSRSYFKMVELLEVAQFFQTVQKESRGVRSAHCAEGPGGFIQALYTRAEALRRPMIASYAITLKPTNPHVPGWKKATAFLNKWKQVKIHYGADGTGDIYNPENQESFVKYVEAPVHLFTADGGFDFSIDYTQQEHKVYLLLVCSALMGLRTLRHGGFMIIKIFDCNSVHTKILLAILGRSFNSWTLYKPAMTRPCNSERYFIGKELRMDVSQSIEYLKLLRERAAVEEFPHLASDDAFFSAEERAFFTRHIETSTTQQIQAIQHAIELSQDTSRWWKDLYLKYLTKSYNWCETFRILFNPKPSHLGLTFSRFPTQTAHISHKGVYQQ